MMKIHYTMMLQAVALCFAMITPLSSQTAAPEIVFIGDLRQIGSNSLAGDTALKTLLSKPHVYGLGMTKGLAGELLVFDSKAYLSSFQSQQYELNEIKNGVVAFGVFATVPQWQPVSIPDDTKTFKDLEVFILKAGEQAGMDTTKPFPFRLTASVIGLRWFVVHGMGNLLPTPEDSFMRQIIRGGLDDGSIEAFGVHSTKHRGIYTNPVSNIHMHFRLQGSDRFVAHLDDNLILKPGGKLLLPKQ